MSKHFTLNADTAKGKNTFDMHMGMPAFKMSHDLADHPLLSLESVVQLAHDLPIDKVDYNRANLPNDASNATVVGNGLSPAQTVREIETCGSWMVLKGIEHVPAYAALLDELVDELAEMTGVSPSDFGHRAGYVFVTSPGGVTPYHLDTEHNFLLHVRGTKTMTILPHLATTTAQDTELSPAKSRYIRFRPEFAALKQVFTLNAGDALCVPFNDPHFVENSDQVSISMGITFHDAQTWKVRKVAHINHMLRRIGLPQPRAGEQPVRDTIKAAAYDAMNAVLDPIRNNTATRQFVKKHILRGAAVTP